MRIREATREDLPGILEIYNEAVVNSTATYDYEPRTMEAQEEWFDAHLRDRYPVWVALDEEGRVLGWSSLSTFHDRPGYRFTAENSVYIAPDHRGKGIGRQLMSPLIESARRMGLHAIIAGVDTGNAASLRFHERLGFVQVGHLRQVGYKFDRWLDVVYLELLLEDG